ncbi:MAG: hypothetical protein KIT14_07000 [bacterium]|nr:hypothetical protein [bacterium]
MHAEHAPVTDILGEIARQSGALIVGGVDADARLTVSFDGPTLVDALGRLFRTRSFTVAYGANGRLRTIRLLAGHDGSASVTALAMPPDESSLGASADSTADEDQPGLPPLTDMFKQSDEVLAGDDLETYLGAMHELHGDDTLAMLSTLADESPSTRVRRFAARAAALLESDPDVVGRR